MYSHGSHFDKTRPSSLNFEFYTVYMQCCYRASFNLVYLFAYISIMSIHMHVGPLYSQYDCNGCKWQGTVLC